MDSGEMTLPSAAHYITKPAALKIEIQSLSERLDRRRIAMSRSFILFILLAASQGCGFLSRSNRAEVVFAATEVGSPQGDKVSKEIGPASGTLVSPDG